MNKTSYDKIKIVIVSVLVSFFAFIFFGRFVAAKISTLPVLNKWKILNPQAPIVITNREQVRVSDGSDIIEAANAAKSKLGTVVRVTDGRMSPVGGAVNVTSDGLFVTGGAVFDQAVEGYFVVLNDGRTAPVDSVVTDKAVNLVFFRAKIDGVPAVSLGSSGALIPGEKILFVLNSTLSHANKILGSFVAFSQGDVGQQVFHTDRPTRSFGAQSVSPLMGGQAVVNTKGELVGIWNGAVIVSSDVLKQAVALHLSKPQNVTRPTLGFSYVMLGKPEIDLLGLPEGARVADIDGPAKPSVLVPAAAAGLKEGDVIIEINGEKIAGGKLLEEMLEKYKPGDQLKLVVQRAGQQVNLTLVAGGGE